MEFNTSSTFGNAALGQLPPSWRCSLVLFFAHSSHSSPPILCWLQAHLRCRMPLDRFARTGVVAVPSRDVRRSLIRVWAGLGGAAVQAGATGHASDPPFHSCPCQSEYFWSSAPWLALQVPWFGSRPVINDPILRACARKIAFRALSFELLVQPLGGLPPHTGSSHQRLFVPCLVP